MEEPSATSSPNTRSAVQRALEIPEILEQVLGRLPPKQLLLNQRTCRLWHGVINDSPQLQRQLFMRADWRFEGRKRDPNSAIYLPPDRPVNNLMLRSVLGGMYPRMTLVLPKKTDDATKSDSSGHGAVRRREDEDEESPGTARQRYFSWDICVSVPATRSASSPTTNPAISFEDASWRKMFLSQPPATSLHLCRRWQRAPEPALECKEGIRMAQVMEKASQNEKAWSKVFIGSDRDWHLEGPINFSHFARIAHENPALDRQRSLDMSTVVA